MSGSFIIEKNHSFRYTVGPMVNLTKETCERFRTRRVQNAGFPVTRNSTVGDRRGLFPRLIAVAKEFDAVVASNRETTERISSGFVANTARVLQSLSDPDIEHSVIEI